VLEAQERDGAVARNRRCRPAIDALSFLRLAAIEMLGHRTISLQRSRISSGDQLSPLLGATPSVIAILKAES